MASILCCCRQPQPESIFNIYGDICVKHVTFWKYAKLLSFPKCHIMDQQKRQHLVFRYSVHFSIQYNLYEENIQLFLFLLNEKNWNQNR